MKRATDTATVPLPLDTRASDEPSLRAAYERSTVRFRYRFESALRVPALAICLRNAALAARRGGGR